MNQESLTEEPPGQKKLKEIAEAIEKNPFLKTCLCLDGAEFKAEPPDRITSTTKRGKSTTIRVKIKGEQVKLTNETGTIVCFPLRSP